MTFKDVENEISGSTHKITDYINDSINDSIDDSINDSIKLSSININTR